MFLDTSFNYLSTVLLNIYDSFVETSTKTWRYAKCLPVEKQPGWQVLTSQYPFQIRNFKPMHCNILYFKQFPFTYDHRLKKTGHPVRSAIHKLEIGGLVVGSVTTSEYPLLYVFDFLLLLFFVLPFITISVVTLILCTRPWYPVLSHNKI
jgi:hypothetical protein